MNHTLLPLQSIESETDTEKLLSLLNECLAITTETIIRIASILKRLEALGVDLIELKIRNLNYYRKIAAGQLLPELFLEASGCPMLLRQTMTLPLQDQKRIAENKPVKVMLTGGDHLLIEPKNLTAQQIKQVFSATGLRSEGQQISWLMEQRERTQIKGQPRPEVIVDRKNHGIRVDSVFISAADLTRYLSQLV